MGRLKGYEAKRELKKTPEPKAKIPAPSKKQGLRFVVQKHDASHLHYDFRLELHGVLLSWAVPKGPSLNPADKRLAIMVEDHPFAYRNFEGVIPEGNYGAGTVMVWDEGTYSVPDAKSKKEAESLMDHGLKKGHIFVQLEGEKLKGGFNLVKMERPGQKNTWLLIKKNDEEASTKDVTKRAKSAKTGRTLKQIEKEES